MGNYVSRSKEMADVGDSLLDLSFLSEEERKKIEQVLKADQDLRTRDRARLGTLRQEIEQERHHQKQFLDKRQCACCEQPLGVLFNSGTYCPDCQYLVCKQCRRTPCEPPPNFVCTVCAKQRLLDIQTGDYIPPSITTSNHPPSTCLYGSELIRQSLEAARGTGEGSNETVPLKLNPVPVKHERTLGTGTRLDDLPGPWSIPRTDTSSTSTSIVVRYVEGDKEGYSPSPAGEEHRVSLARRVPLEELSDSDKETDENDEVFLPVMKYLNRSDSIGSMDSVTSMYSASWGKGDYKISGRVQFGVWYKEGQLFVRVNKGQGIAAAKKSGFSDPYIKLYLLPDKSKRTKRKTGVKRRTINPVYNEILKYKLPQTELKFCTLWLSVWDWDRFGRNQFLGEVRLALSSLDLTDSKDQWYTLQDKEDSAMDAFFPGKLRLGLKFSPYHEFKDEPKRKMLGSLHIAIKQAQELPPMDTHGLTDATVKCYLLPNRSTSGKRKTKVIKNNLNPVWEEHFVYNNVTLGELSRERVLEVTVWDYDRRGSNDFIGGLHLGPGLSRAAKHSDLMNSIGEELSHWEAMLSHPGEWVEKWHTLRATIDPMTSKHAASFVPPAKELSPVQELSPTQEQETSPSEGQLPTLDAYSFTPPVVLTPPLTENPSTNDTGGRKGDYDITGEVLVGVEYKDGQLLIHVNRARGLAAADSNGLSDPYIKTYLLPDKSKHSKRKTDTKKKTLDPVYDQTLEYKVSMDDLTSRTLWLSVWDWDGIGRNQFLGEVCLPVSSMDFNDPSPSWYPLQEKDVSGVSTQPDTTQPDTTHHGRLSLGLMFTPTSTKKGNIVGTVSVAIKQARDLPNMDTRGLSDGFVKCYLLPDRSASGKRKTKVIKNNLNPIWEEQFVYRDVALEELSAKRVLEVTVWDYDVGSSNDFIGCLRLGPTPGLAAKHSDWMDSIGEEASHWEAMLAQPGEWVEKWHTLRPTMDPRDIELSKSPSLSPRHEATEEKTVEKAVPVESHTAETSVRSHPLKRSSQVLSKAPAYVRKGKSPQTVINEEEEDPHTSGPSNPSTSPAPSPPPAESYSTQTTALQGLKHYDNTSNFGSMNSVYSAAGGKGDYDIAGEVLVGVEYKGGQLLIHVNKARGLAAADSNGLSDPYVKTYLLPDKSKHSKKKTTIKKKTLDPVYNETLKYKLPQAELNSRTLWLSVWDWDRFGRNQFLGEVRLALSSLDLTDSTAQWYTLQDKDEATHGEVDTFYHGELRLGLLYTPGEKDSKKGTLTVLVRQAKELPIMDPNGLANAAVKCYLLPDRSASGKCKTGVIKNNLNPVWEEQFVYKNVTLEELSGERVLEVTVWDYDKHGNEFIGGLRLGPTPSHAAKHKDWMDSIGEEISHWEAMLAHPGEWVEQWQTLRTTMVPRKLDLSSVPPFLSSEASYNAEEEATQAPSHWLPHKQLHPSSESLEDEFRKIQTSPSRQQQSLPSQTRDENEYEALFGAKVMVHPQHKPPTQSPKVEENSTESLFGAKVSVRTHHTPVEKQQPPRTSSTNVSVQLRDSTLEEGPLMTTPTMQLDDEAQQRLGPEGEMAPAPATVVSLRNSPETQEDAHFSRIKVATPVENSGLLRLKHAQSDASFGSMASIYSAAGGKGDYAITGEILFGVYYKDGQLLVHVNKARELAAADSNGLSDPYVKTYLLPDKSKHSKKKTEIKRKTLDPVYNQTLKYKLPQAELNSRTLWLSVWDWDRFGRNQFLGEVRLALSSLDLTDSTDQWYTLQDKDEGGETGGDTYRGQLKVALMLALGEAKKGKTKATLKIVIKQARDLPSMEAKGVTDGFVKCYLLPDRSNNGKRKTKVIKSNLNPVWEEQFTYDKLILEELSRERVLEVTIWDYHKHGSDFIGGLRLGPTPGHAAKHKDWMDSIGEELSHWEAMLAHPGEWVEQWHTLRTTMDPRSVGSYFAADDVI